jgi:hypothetical protein
MEGVQASLEVAFREYLKGIGERDSDLDEVPVHVAWCIAEQVALRTVARLGCDKAPRPHTPNEDFTGAIRAAEQAFRVSLDVDFDLNPTKIPEKEIMKTGRDAAREVISYFRWHQALAPYITDEDVEKLNHDPKGEASSLAEAGTLLAMPGSSGHWYFPEWQFKPGTAQLRRITHDIMVIFQRREIRNVTSVVISWAATPQPELNGGTPREFIDDDSRRAAILASARSLARRLDS